MTAEQITDFIANGIWYGFAAGFSVWFVASFLGFILRHVKGMVG